MTRDAPPLAPVTLEGNVVRLEPLASKHVDGLVAVGLDPSLWALTVARVRDAADLRAWIESALADQRAGSALPFAIVLRDDNRVIGATRFGSYAPSHRRVEIGWTWVSPQWQRSAVNTEAKYLLLKHAFDTLKLLRVEFKTDVINVRSRAAILRIGAQEEGILRRHQVTESGRVRDSIYFAITDLDWPTVRQELERRLGR